jgi:hypothetical protein
MMLTVTVGDVAAAVKDPNGLSPLSFVAIGIFASSEQPRPKSERKN